MITLGLDIGSNSVGSSWVDLSKREAHLAVSVFPAGVDETEDKRGAPKNQARRQTRSQRRTIERRARRKRLLTIALMERGLLPRDPGALGELYGRDPWQLRRRGLSEPLTPHDFGRLLVHLAQRRGAVGVISDPENADEGKVKEGMDRLEALMRERRAETVGQLMAELIHERRREHNGTAWHEPVRNRQYRMAETQQLFAGRESIRREFHKLVAAQRSFHDSPLSKLLADELVRELDDPRKSDTWRHQGWLFGQRGTYWDTGRLGRCVLEPAERCAPIADRHASYFRVLEIVNNIRIVTPGIGARALTADQRSNVLQLVRGPLGERRYKGALVPKTSVSVGDIREKLGLSRRRRRADAVQLNIEADEERELNTDWFHREVVHGAFGEDTWNSMTEATREAVNRAILKFDPSEPGDAERLLAGAKRWWALDDAAAERLVSAWKQRPRLEKRLNLSRRAVRNLIPYMEQFDEENGRWSTQQEARKAYAKLLRAQFEETGESWVELAARRYETAALGLTAADRYYMRQPKHQLRDEHAAIIHDSDGNPLPVPPPAPMVSNPVVRKAIHEVRRHLVAWMRKFRTRPDRIVIEFARGVKDTAKRRNAQLAANREREKERKLIEENLRAWGIPESNWDRAVLRVRLCKEQAGVCPFSLQGPNASRTITEKMAAEGADVEREHIVPEGLTGKTMAFNNLVLCFREANRGKGMRTPLDWLGPEGVKAMLQRLENAPIKGNRSKWKRLQEPTPDEAEFRNSQLTDTAYAARQVAAYIADALYDGDGLPERGGLRRIFTTKGEFTARLRADWGLHESTIDRESGLEAAPSAEAVRTDPHIEQAFRRARKDAKDRSDHRHHAIDALAIALVGPELLNEVARHAREDREYRERTGHWPRRRAIEQPSAWPTLEAFHEDVLAAVRRLVVSNRPVKRRLAGAFHEAEHYGPIIGPLPAHRRERLDTLYTNKVAIYANSRNYLTPNHLRVPERWDELSSKLEEAAFSDAQKRAIRRELAAMPDPPPAKSGIVRDRALRDRIRKCLRGNGLNPDDFTAAQIKQLATEAKVTMASGVPIKSVVLLRTNTDPVIVPRKQWDPAAGRLLPHMDPDDPSKPHPRTKRVYIGGNNHHVEIREDSRGRWSGRIVSTFEAAQRVRPAANPDGSKRPAQPAVDRASNAAGDFVMSLSEGEMMFARRKDRPDGPADYYVVCKLDKAGNSCRIHFAAHWDARKAAEQDRWAVAPADLKACGPRPQAPPEKVRVGPLGGISVLVRD